MSDPEPMDVALHEAAHAVIGLDLGFMVKSVSVNPTEISLGSTTFVEEPTGHAGALVSLAGPATNFELGLDDGVGCDADAFDAVTELHGGDFRAAFLEAQELVRGRRDAIAAVARLVLERGSVGGSDLSRFVESLPPTEP